MAEVLASGVGIGVFALVVQILALIAVHGAASRKEVRFHAMAFVLASCVMAGLATLDPLAFTQWHVDGLAAMAMCG